MNVYEQTIIIRGKRKCVNPREYEKISVNKILL